MDTQRRWIAFDTFKLIVALLLLALLLVLFLQRPSVSPPTGTGGVSPAVAAGAAQQPAPTKTAVSPTTAPTNTVAPTLAPKSTDTPVKPTAAPTTPPPTPTATAAATAAAATATVAAEATTAPTLTETPAPAATAATQSQAASTSADCPLAAPSRLAVGKQAVVVANLNMREGAGMDKPILKVSQPNSKLEVIGGPTCVPYQKGAYLWWQVKTQDGISGWSAEASMSKTFYFLQPVP